LNNKGKDLSDLGNYTEAIKMYYKAILANQWGNISYDGKGYSLFKLGEIDGGIQSAGNSITLNPEYANAWYNLAMYSIEKNKTDESLSNLRNARTDNQQVLNVC
jgi:tetratricopeptide (TPR) repeat protein